MSSYIPKSDTGGKSPEERWELMDNSVSSPSEGDLYLKLSERTREIDTSLINAKKDLEDLKNNTESKINYVLYIAIGIIVVFVLASLPIFLDYFRNNEERYEKFIDKTVEIKNSSYSKNEVDGMIKSFKDCIWFNGLSHCLK